MTASAKPGQTVEINWNFFNLRGDRPTHVLVSQSEGSSWNVIYSPKAENKSYDISGIVTSSFENFVMDKSQVVKEKPTSIYVTHPNSSEGYILVDKQMKIYVTIPEDVKIGEQKEFVFIALGKCFGETGSVAASLATELKVKITPTTDYYEKPIENIEDDKGQTLGLFSSQTKIKPAYMILSGITLILLIMFVVLILMARAKIRKKSKRKNEKK